MSEAIKKPYAKHKIVPVSKQAKERLSRLADALAAPDPMPMFHGPIGSREKPTRQEKTLQLMSRIRQMQMEIQNQHANRKRTQAFQASGYGRS